jgi:hypothetical protein
MMAIVKSNHQKGEKPKKKKFSSFTSKDAFQQLNLKQLLPWTEHPEPIAPSAFLQERLNRLQEAFDLKSCEDAKKLIIDAVCEEILLQCARSLKIWKSAPLEGETTYGIADYLIAAKQSYLETPYLCIVEAKKDDFEQGLAQCLVEMQACQWENQQVGRSIDILGIVSNGNAWAFYKLTTDQQAYETELYALTDIENVLGWLRHVFQMSERNLLKPQE